MTTLKERILALSDNVNDLDDEMVSKMNKLIDMMERLALYKPLSDEEAAIYRKVVAKMIPPRFNNYKKDSPLKLHYRDVVDDKVDEIVALSQQTSSICSGVCTPQLATAPCLNAFDFDARDPQLVLLEFDHWLERDAIYREISRCLKEIVIPQTFIEQYPGASDVGYVMKNFEDPIRTVLQRDIYNMLNDLLNLPLMIDDLYGSNIFIRCKACHTACKSSANHPRMTEGRYRRDG
jgi:hypothetical protein